MDLKNKHYIYFRFYTNISDEIVEFKNELKKIHPNIITIKETLGMFGAKEVQVYFNSKKECDKAQNNKTLSLYKKFVGKGAYWNK